MKATLLDVNVLVALFDPAHLHHDAAHEWFGSMGASRWATCPITVNGCLRVLGNVSYPAAPLTINEVAARLRELCARGGHEFWSDSISSLDKCIDWTRCSGPGQITDVYLLALALANDGRLVTFDRALAWQAVAGAKRSDVLILGR